MSLFLTKHPVNLRDSTLTESCVNFTKHHYLMWRDGWASFIPFVAQFFFPSLFSPTLPETSLLHKVFHSFFALHTIVWAAWVVGHYSLFFFFFTRKKKTFQRPISVPCSLVWQEEYGYMCGRKKETFLESLRTGSALSPVKAGVEHWESNDFKAY